jgi:hypothetical protein
MFEHYWSPMDENTLKSPKIIIAKYIFFMFQNFDKMFTPNLMPILCTLGRFKKFGTWFYQLLQKIQQRMKILYMLNIYGPN